MPMAVSFIHDMICMQGGFLTFFTVNAKAFLHSNPDSSVIEQEEQVQHRLFQ